MAIYFKWHMCPCHEPLVAQILICSNTFGLIVLLVIYLIGCVLVCSLTKKQLCFMLGRQQVFLELPEDEKDGNELCVELISNSQLNQHFLALAREVSLLIRIYSKLSL